MHYNRLDRYLDNTTRPKTVPIASARFLSPYVELHRQTADNTRFTCVFDVPFTYRLEISFLRLSGEEKGSLPPLQIEARGNFDSLITRKGCVGGGGWEGGRGEGLVTVIHEGQLKLDYLSMLHANTP